MPGAPHVLVAEDDLDIRDLFELKITAIGLSVRPSPTGCRRS